MKKKCPNCGKEVEETLTVCPFCSDSFQPIPITQSQESVDPHDEEPIAWSELKDLSIDHVMTMFHQQTDSDSQNKKESRMQTMTDKKEEQTAKPLDAANEEITSEATPEIEETTVQETKAAAQETTAEASSTTTDETENSATKKAKDEIEIDKVPIFFKDDDLNPEDFYKSDQEKDVFQRIEEVKITSDEKETPTQTENNPSKKKWPVMLFSALALLGVGGFGVYSYQNQSAPKAKENVQSAEQQSAAQVKKELESFFLDDKQEYLRPEMVTVGMGTIQKNLDALKDTKDYNALHTLYETIQTKQKEITSVNQLFESPIIDGDQLKDVALKADQPIRVEAFKEKEGLHALLNQGIQAATEQYEQLQKAKEAVNQLFDGETVNAATATSENYLAAKAEVDKIKSKTLRSPLLDKLAQVDNHIITATSQTPSTEGVTEDLPAEETAIDNESAAADTTVNAPAATTYQAPDASTFTPPNSNGVYTDPVYTVNPTDVADQANPAWIWAPGVKERVIQICIQRGYIVEGGYTLEPARIVNGQGYYNLYATNNQSSLLSGTSESHLPVYIVTINAQTGWFKGNASRNAGR